MQYSAAAFVPHDGKFAPLAGYACTGETLLIANVDVAKNATPNENFNLRLMRISLHINVHLSLLKPTCFSE
jgi:hypothetical protein